MIRLRYLNVSDNRLAQLPQSIGSLQPRGAQPTHLLTRCRDVHRLAASRTPPGNRFHESRNRGALPAVVVSRLRGNRLRSCRMEMGRFRSSIFDGEAFVVPPAVARSRIGAEFFSHKAHMSDMNRRAFGRTAFWVWRWFARRRIAQTAGGIATSTSMCSPRRLRNPLPCLQPAGLEPTRYRR
jgi:hypothetical protein